MLIKGDWNRPKMHLLLYICGWLIFCFDPNHHHHRSTDNRRELMGPDEFIFNNIWINFSLFNCFSTITCNFILYKGGVLKTRTQSQQNKRLIPFKLNHNNAVHQQSIWTKRSNKRRNKKSLLQGFWFVDKNIWIILTSCANSNRLSGCLLIESAWLFPHQAAQLQYDYLRWVKITFFSKFLMRFYRLLFSFCCVSCYLSDLGSFKGF